MSMEQTAEAFSSHRFEEAYPHLSPDVSWNLVGGRLIEGKEDVVGACDQSAAYLAGCETTFNRFRTLTADGCVVIDSEARYVDQDGQSSVVASCDIYDFAGDQLTHITSYTVELLP